MSPADPIVAGPATTITPLFERDGDDRYVPTVAAAGPWQPGVLHGGAVAALLAGLLEHPGQSFARVLVELLGPVPNAPLRVAVGPSEGGRRVLRQSVELFAADRPVARASALRMRLTELDLPDAATRHPIVFDPQLAPGLTMPSGRAAAEVGRECFDSIAMASWWEPFEPGTGERLRMWLRLLVPVVDGRPASAVERTVAAADYASGGTSARIGFRSWTFMNADMVVAFSRVPVGDWVGLECDGLLGRTGSGQSVATIHDAHGPVAQSSQSILVEPR